MDIDCSLTMSAFYVIRKQRWPFSHDSFINTEIYDKMNESFFIDYNHD